MDMQTIMSALPPAAGADTTPSLDAPVEALAPTLAKPKKKLRPRWKQRIETCERLRDKIARDWKENVNYRKNQPFQSSPDTDQVAVPVDWARTKNKQADLFFQVPDVKLAGRYPEADATAPLAAAALNFKLQKELRFSYTMDEILGDVINAAGIGICACGYDAEHEMVSVPAIDTTTIPPEQVQMMKEAGSLPMTEAPNTIYSCYYARRISPANFLWPVEFTGSDWQKADWLGYQDKIPLAEALRLGWVDDDYEAEYGDKLETVNPSNDDTDRQDSASKCVKYSRIFYRMNCFDPEEKDPRKIGHLVFVEHVKEPVVDEPLKWQKYVPETRKWIGVQSFPIKVLTLTTISDEALPPSDSRIGRNPVRELNKFRTQMIRQRDRSMPLRWFDINLVDEEIAEQMRKGVFQDMIPMNGPGDHAVGEVARASFPRESYESQKVIEHDLDQAWSAGANQQGFESAGDTSATEARIVQDNYSRTMRYEQGKTLRFFLEIGECIFGLMQLFQDDEEFVQVLGPNRARALQAWDRTKIPGEYTFDASADAALSNEVGQKRQELQGIYKIMRRDPKINPQPLINKLLETYGMDPAEFAAEPSQPPPDKPNVRFSFKGEDLLNPVCVAIIQKGGQPISPADIEAAKILMRDAGLMGAPPPPAPPIAQGPPLPPTPAPPAPPNPGHPGPPAVVEPLNQRYERGAQSGS